MRRTKLTRREFLEKSSTAVVAASIAGGALATCEKLLGESPSSAMPSELFDIAPFGRRCVADEHHSQVVFDYESINHRGPAAEKVAEGKYIYGLQWAEERDVEEVRVLFAAKSAPIYPVIEYWFWEWPYPRPVMPTFEDPSDDPWQGRWLKAETKTEVRGSEVIYRFLPLEIDENPAAGNLDGLKYRRALKMRLIFPSAPEIEKVQFFTGSARKTVQLRIELGVGEAGPYEWKGKVSAYNGIVNAVRLWNGAPKDSVDVGQFHVSTTGEARGLLIDLTVTEPSLPGSYDLTVVTIEADDRTFSFAVDDVMRGPVYVPDFRAYVTVASDSTQFSPSIVKKGQKIRDRLATEPEQSYERAMREIPGAKPRRKTVAPATSIFAARYRLEFWQKFALEWGGNVMISKIGIKAKGAELKRLDWAEDQIRWLIGTGASPTFRPNWHDSKLHILEDCLPVVTAEWATDGIEYVEEAFATSLGGPLSAGGSREERADAFRPDAEAHSAQYSYESKHSANLVGYQPN